MDQMYGHGHHHHDDPWRDAPPWAVELAMMLLVILDKVAPGNLSPKDQEIVDKIYTIETSDIRKIDNALK